MPLWALAAELGGTLATLNFRELFFHATRVNKDGRKGQSALGVDLSLSSPSAAGGLGPIY